MLFIYYIITQCLYLYFTVEEGADNLISSLLDMNAKAKKTEELLDAIEEERFVMKIDILYILEYLLKFYEFFLIHYMQRRRTILPGFMSGIPSY